MGLSVAPYLPSLKRSCSSFYELPAGREILELAPGLNSIEEREEILNAVERLGPWYHSFNLADWLKIEATQSGIPADVRGKDVMDIGCWDDPDGY